MIHVEVVLILARFDEELEIAVFPPRPAPARPHPKLLVFEEVLVAFRGESQKRLGAITDRQPRRQQPQRPLVDLRGAELKGCVAPAGLIPDAGWRDVAEIAVLRADDRRDNLARTG